MKPFREIVCFQCVRRHFVSHFSRGGSWAPRPEGHIARLPGSDRPSSLPTLRRNARTSRSWPCLHLAIITGHSQKGKILFLFLTVNIKFVQFAKGLRRARGARAKAAFGGAIVPRGLAQPAPWIGFFLRPARTRKAAAAARWPNAAPPAWRRGADRGAMESLTPRPVRAERLEPAQGPRSSMGSDSLG